MGTLSRKAYEEIIENDVDWLRKQPKTLERDHILMVLQWAVRYEYEFIKPVVPRPTDIT